MKTFCPIETISMIKNGICQETSMIQDLKHILQMKATFQQFFKACFQLATPLM